MGSPPLEPALSAKGQELLRDISAFWPTRVGSLTPSPVQRPSDSGGRRWARFTRGLTIPEGLVSPSRDEQPREATSIDQRRGKSERHRGQRTKTNDATGQNQDASNRRYT